MRKTGYVLFRKASEIEVESETPEIEHAEVHLQILEINGKEYLGFACPICKNTIAIEREDVKKFLNPEAEDVKLLKRYISRKKR